jgi:hypothetical protein
MTADPPSCPTVRLVCSSYAGSPHTGNRQECNGKTIHQTVDSETGLSARVWLSGIGDRARVT